MRIDIRGKNLRVTQALRNYVEEKIGHLQHYLDDIIDAHVTLRTERNLQIVDVTLLISHYLIKAEERSPDMYASIDLVRDRLEQQIRKFKTRRRDPKHRVNGKAPAAGARRTANPKAGETPKIVRSKRFAVKPMDTDEAIYQMELLGHDFFMFVNAETETVNVLYKRKSGDLGLLEPIM